MFFSLLNLLSNVRRKKPSKSITHTHKRLFYTQKRRMEPIFSPAPPARHPAPCPATQPCLAFGEPGTVCPASSPTPQTTPQSSWQILTLPSQEFISPTLLLQPQLSTPGEGTMAQQKKLNTKPQFCGFKDHRNMQFWSLKSIYFVFLEKVFLEYLQRFLFLGASLDKSGYDRCPLDCWNWDDCRNTIETKN